MMNEKKLLTLWDKYGQEHLIAHYKKLSRVDKDTFLESMKELDFDLVFKLHSLFRQPESTHSLKKIEPARIITLQTTTEELYLRNKALALGKSMMRNNKIAVLIAAGGQGSRLGFDGPKGAFPVTTVRKKSLFQLFSETIIALSRRYHATIPFLIMTSEDNHNDTIAYFNINDYFGLDRKSIYFFKQSMLPSITPDGKLVLKDKTHLFVNPDGHGGVFKALLQSGLLKDLQDQGISDIFYCQIDNPLVKIADPLFIGYHKMYQAEISTKVVRRKNTEERVGIYLSVDGKDTIVEYSDSFAKKIMSVLDKDGNLLYWAGNIAVHMLNISFIERLNAQGLNLPYHRATKNIHTIDERGNPVITTGWKFETFIFDAIPLAKKTCCMEAVREEEFSPIKNRDGEHSPKTARRDMNNLYRKWLQEAGFVVPSNINIEISPLFALDKEELKVKLKGKRLSFEKDIYLGENFKV